MNQLSPYISEDRETFLPNVAADRVDVRWQYDPESGILTAMKGTQKAILAVAPHTAFVGTYLGIAIEGLDAETVEV